MNTFFASFVVLKAVLLGCDAVSSVKVTDSSADRIDYCHLKLQCLEYLREVVTLLVGRLDLQNLHFFPTSRTKYLCGAQSFFMMY